MLLFLFLWTHYQQHILLRWITNGIKKDEQPELPRTLDDIAQHLTRQREQSTRRKRKLQHFLSTYRELVQAIPDIALIVDADGRLLGFNQHAQEVLGFDRRMDLGNKVDHLIRGEGLPSFWEQAKQYESFVLRLLSTTNLRLEFIQVPLQRNNILLLARDVTKIYNEQARRKAFIDNASHELKTPITVIQGFLEIMGTQPDLPAKWRMPVTEMQKHAERMNILVEDMLRLARLESPKTELNESSIIFKAWLKDLVEQVNKQFPDSIGIACTIVDDFILEADMVILHSMLANLLQNALLHAQSKHAIEVSATFDTNHVIITVHDDGIGIASEHIERITERFYRVDNQRKNILGSGLGLAIVKHGTEVHGGSLHILSEENKGTTFQIKLPITRIKHHA